MRRIFTLAPALLFSMTAPAQSLTEDVQNSDVAYPVVITPTRLRQSLPDVPASVTVITSDTLQTYGITSVVEALRLVPGMQVIRLSGYDWYVSYHGTNLISPRRMNVLIDGISVYRPGFARVLWQQLPVAIVDVDRIEVTRGPNSASYGPNSMLAIVNIITKHPKDVEKGMIDAFAGSQGVAGVSARVGAVYGNTRLRVTASIEHDGGYDYLTRSDPQGHDSTRLKRLNAKSATEIDPDTALDVQASYVEGLNEVPFVEPFQASFPDMRTRDYVLSGRLTRQLSSTHELQVAINRSGFGIKQPWRSCPPTALLLPELFQLWRVNPNYANAIIRGQLPKGGSPEADSLAMATVAAIRKLGARATATTCGTTNQDILETRTDFELQDTQIFSDWLRVVSGVGARKQRVTSGTWLGGTQSTDLYRLFANAELTPKPWLRFNIGGYGEHESNTGWSWSPRAAVNARLTETQTVRFVVSKGTRTPDLYEQKANWTYPGTDASPALNGSTRVLFFQSAVSPGNLRPEQIVSKELGYMLQVPHLGMTLDLKLFDDRLSHLISEKLQLSDFHPTNSNSVRLSGIEVQTTAQLKLGWSSFLNYAYLRNHQATTPLEETAHSRHSGAVGLSRSTEGGMHWSLAYFGASGDGLGQNPYGRTDVTVGRTFTAEGMRYRATATVSRLNSRTTAYLRDLGSSLESRFNSRLQVRGELEVSF